VNPRISVILPFFNSAAFLVEAIESVRSQTYEDWELLLVDDGSKDTSLSIAEQYVKVDPFRIFLLRHEDRANHGAAASRNLALRFSRGEIVALIDSDDVWLPQKLDCQVALLDSNPGVAMVYGKSEYSYHCTQPLAANLIPRLATPKIYFPPELLRTTFPLGKGGSPCPSSLIFRRSAAIAIGGFVEEFAGPYCVYEDIAFLAKMFVRYPIYVSEECWDRYRIHPYSVSALARGNGDEVKARAFYFGWLAHHMEQTGVIDRKIWSLYRRRTWEYRHSRLARYYRAVRARARPVAKFSKWLPTFS
jgi:glycosyltransferase involved in cell wall biosynthesis